MSYQLRQDPSFKRFTKEIKEKQLQDKIKGAIIEIQANPYEAGEQKKGDLFGVFCYNIRHAKVSYEIAYIIQEHNGKLIIVIHGGTRENFYKTLKKHIDNK